MLTARVKVMRWMPPKMAMVALTATKAPLAQEISTMITGRSDLNTAQIRARTKMTVVEPKTVTSRCASCAASWL